jgi:hypothetical protein
MYPKKPSSVLTGSGQSSIKKNFLNDSQREELKRRLIEKFTKIYSPSDPDAVKSKVNEFFRVNAQINASNLQQLENSIKSKSKDGAASQTVSSQPPPASGEKKGAPGQKPPSRGQVEARGASGPASERNESKITQQVDENGKIKFRNEEDEWAVVSKYNYYLHKKEEKELRKKAEETKKILKTQLDQQLAEKHMGTRLNAIQEDSYNKAREKILEIEEKKENERKQLLKDKMKFEKEMRDMQMKEIDERRKYEKDQEKALDAFILEKIKEDIVKEQTFFREKKKAEYEKMKNMLDENEDRKKIMAELKEKERKEDVQLQQAYSKLVEEQEERRAAEFRAKEERMQQFMDRSKEGALKEKDDRDKQLELRLKRYEEAKERKLQERERAKAQQAELDKKKYKQFLDSQVSDKKDREQSEKMKMAEQAQIWKKDTNQFNDYEKRKEEDRKKAYSEYSKELKDQMAERAKREAKVNMADYEALLNKKIMEDIRDPELIQEIENQKHFEEVLDY